MYKRLLCILAVAIVAILLTSCANRETTNSKGQRTVHVSFVSNCVADFWFIAKEGCEDAGKKFNAQCDYRMPSVSTSTEQKTLVEDVMSRGAEALAISPIDPENQSEMLDRLSERIKVICSDSDAPKSKRICYIGTSNIEAGTLVGKELVKALPNGGKVMIFTGSLDLKNLCERIEGVKQGVAGSKIEIIGIKVDNLDRAKCVQNAEDAITKYRDLVGMVGIAGMNAPACAKAVVTAGKKGKIKVVGFDAEEDPTLEAVKDGSISAVVAQNPYKMGYESVRVMAALLRGEDPKLPKDGKINTGVTVVNKDNVDERWARLKAMRKKMRS